MQWDYEQSFDQLSVYENFTPTDFLQFNQFVNFDEWQVKPIRVSLNPGIGDHLIAYQLTTSSPLQDSPKGWIYQALDSGLNIFLGILRESSNVLECVFIDQNNTDLIIVPWVGLTNLSLKLAITPKAVTVSSGVNSFQTFEWTLTQPTTFLAVPNFAQLDQVNSKLSVNGIEQNSLLDYNFDNEQINWISPDFSLGEGDFISFLAIYS